MDEQSCQINEPPAQTRYAGEWGLATLLLAGFQSVAAVLMLVVAVLLIQDGLMWRTEWTAIHVLPITLAAAAAILWCTTVVSIAFGRHALRAAWKRCQPGGLPLAGIVLAIAAFVLWTVDTLVLWLWLLQLYLPGTR